MIRMKDRLYQVVVGENMQHPIDTTVTHIYRTNEGEFGKVLLGKQKHRVRAIGGGVWVLKGISSISSIVPISSHNAA